MHPSLLNLIEEKNMEEVVKRNGRLAIPTLKSDYDENENFIGNYSKIHKKAAKFIEKYNPQKLSREKYRKLYNKGELPWQIAENGISKTNNTIQ